jgi:hypothetical protein
MDYLYMIKAFLSLLFFAPGVFVLAACLMLGVLMLIEKAY